MASTMAALKRLTENLEAQNGHYRLTEATFLKTHSTLVRVDVELALGILDALVARVSIPVIGGSERCARNVPMSQSTLTRKLRTAHRGMAY
jgi:hypothetical protein